MKKTILGIVMAMSITTAAQAGTFVWKDDVNGFTFSFPDSWMVQTEDQPTTRIRIAGPVLEDWATCRVQSEKDGRLQIYPKRLMTEAVQETLTRDFWEKQVGEFDQAHITNFISPASLGTKGDATAIRVSYAQDNGKDKMSMYGEMIGSIYGDTRYIMSCSSTTESFTKYAPVFATIMGSVDLDSKYTPFATGYYRNFLADPKLELTRSKPGTL